MSVKNFLVMRGLRIPDNNFRYWPDSWTSAGFDDGDVQLYPAGYEATQNLGYINGTGASLRFSVKEPAVHTTHTITSYLSPLHIGGDHTTIGGSAGYDACFYIGLIMRTSGISDTNTNNLIWARVKGLDEDGDTIYTTSWTTITQDGASNMYYEPDWVYYWDQITISNMAYTDPVVWYKLELGFNDSTEAGDTNAAVWLDSVVLALPMTRTATTYDQFTSWYLANGSHQANTRIKWISPHGAFNPHIRVMDPACRLQTINLQFPHLRVADKQILQMCEMWNRGAPPAGEWWHYLANEYASPLGTSQPLVVVPNREDMKFAMYADLGGPLQFTQGIQGWWPESAGRWSTSASFVERLC